MGDAYRDPHSMRVLEDMEKGGNEWKKPWVEASPLPPHNPVSGTQYSGRNFLYTYVYGMMRGYADPRWATEKQIKEMGWKVPENLQNGRGGINDELGVGIEHWGMYAYIPRVQGDRDRHETPLERSGYLSPDIPELRQRDMVAVEDFAAVGAVGLSGVPERRK